MEDRIIIGVIVTIAIFAHLWLFKWIKFKIDEGTILKCLQESDVYGVHSTESIAANTNMSLARVSSVCRKSKVIKKHEKEKDAWYLGEEQSVEN